MLPVARTSKSRKGMRRAHHALRGVMTVRCPKCGQARRPHRMCGNCGYLNRSLTVALPKETE